MKKYSKYIIALFIVTLALLSICFIPIGISSFIPTVEKQIKSELGVDVHMEKLILRLGPELKVKSPIMHVMYEDGQKFAQFDVVKFYIPWSSIIKNKPVISGISAKKVNVRVNEDDKYLENLIKTLEEKPYDETPKLHFNEYKISYKNHNGDNYFLEGYGLDIKKLKKYQNYSLKLAGIFSINNKKYINYDLNVVPKINMPSIQDINLQFRPIDVLKQIEELDFHTDIIADIKLNKNKNDVIQYSGFINIDNISVLDPKNIMPKSFIYLTFLGERANILSNIYTQPDKKICLDGFINNSKNPTVDIKVKADEINLNDLYKKIKILTNFSKLKNVSEINGLLNANFTLKGDLNKLKSNGYLKINNGGITIAGVNINKIESEMDFSNNIVSIIKAIGYVNGTPIIARGNIGKNINVELMANKIELKYLTPAVFGVEQGILSLVTNITGTLDNIIHKDNLIVENLKIKNDNLSLSIESLKLDNNKNNTAYIRNITCENNYTSKITIPSLNVFIENDKATIPDTNIFLPNSKLTAKSEILNYNNINAIFNINISGFINSKDINSLYNYSAKYPISLSYNGNKNIQNLSGKILVEHTDILDEPSVISLVSKIDKKVIKLEDLSISTYTGKFNDDIRNSTKGIKKAVITGNIENFEHPIYKNFRISIPQQLNIHLFDTLAQFRGDIFLNGYVKSPEIVGQLFINNLFNQSTQLSLSNATIDFNKTSANLNAPLVKLADSTLGINALISNDIRKELQIKNLNIKSKYLNTDTLLMYKDNFLVKQLPVSILDGKFYAEKLYLGLYGSQVYLSQFNSDISLKDYILKMKNITSEGYNGKIAGKIDINLKNESYASYLMARGISAAPIFEIVTPRKETINGTMDFDANISGEISSKKTLNGDLKFIIHNGRMSTLGKLEHLLYAQNVVSDYMLRTSLSVVTKAIMLKDTGLFKYLKGDIAINNGIANIKMLQSQGPLMSLFIKGQYNPDNDYARLTVLGRLSDEVVSGLGAFGEFSFNKLMIMLTGEEKKYHILPEDYNMIPQLPIKNTKEFRSIINGIIDKPSSVVSFNWISYSQKSLRQKEVPMTDIKVPDFVDKLPY